MPSETLHSVLPKCRAAGAETWTMDLMMVVPFERDEVLDGPTHAKYCHQ